MRGVDPEFRRRHRDAAAAGNRKAADGARGNSYRRYRGEASTSDRLYDDDEAEFLAAVDRWCDAAGHRFPTRSDLLAILRGLGYAKPAPLSNG